MTHDELKQIISYYDSGYVAPGAKLTKALRRRGMRKPDEECNQYQYILDLFREPIAETLLKTGRKALLGSRAVNNGRSEWHNDILALIEKNAALLQRTARAHA